MKYKLLFMISTLLFTSCLTNKEINIVVNNSEHVDIDSGVTGSEVEDIKPSLEIPLIP